MGFVKDQNGAGDNRLVVVSNRGACTLTDISEGSCAKPSVSGLVSAVDPIIRKEGGSWIAWGGRVSDERETGVSLPLHGQTDSYIFQEVLLTKEEVDAYYLGFSNRCLWPLLHGFLEKAEFRAGDWEAYWRVNNKYARVLLQRSEYDDLIWVQDFHLALLPEMVRRRRPMARISLFWHVPFPPCEVFAVMPWARQILRGLLSCDFIGFHTAGYVDNFLRSVQELLGADVNFRTGTVSASGRRIKAAAVPIGVDWGEYERAADSSAVQEQAARIRQAVGGKYLLLGIDRLDYTKGIPERLLALEWVLENYPEYRDKINYIQIATPSRTEVPAYQELRRKVEELTGRINGRFNENYHVPVRHINRSFTKEEIIAHYLAADLALVTPLKDGLNLVAKEYVAAKANGEGVLLLSAFAGAAEQLKDALIANPYCPEYLGRQIAAGLQMPLPEKQRRLAALKAVVREQDVYWWWREIQRHWLGGMTVKSVPAMRDEAQGDGVQDYCTGRGQGEGRVNGEGWVNGERRGGGEGRGYDERVCL